ncbi:hypothetical protein IMG5_067520, partial [Ichthyophthirius multifiliis]
MQIMKTISQTLNVFLIPNENPIKALNIISTQTITYNVLKEKHLKLFQNAYYDSINIKKDQENLQYHVNYLEYPYSVITYDDNFPYSTNHPFIINEKTITFEFNQQQIQLDIPLFSIYNLSKAIDNVGNYICIQNIKGKWMTKDCILLYYINDQNQIQQLICQCKTQGKQTLVNDINQVFKEVPINQWYLYASVWTLVATTIIYVMLFIYLQQLDNIQDQKMQKSAIKRNQITEIIFQKNVNEQERNKQLDNILKNDEQIQKQYPIKTPNQKINSLAEFQNNKEFCQNQVSQYQDSLIKIERDTQSNNLLGSLISQQIQSEKLQGKIMPLNIQSNTIENKSRQMDVNQLKGDNQLTTEDKIKTLITHKISKLNTQINAKVVLQQNNQEDDIQPQKDQDKIQDTEKNQVKVQKNNLVKRKKNQSSLIRQQSQLNSQINKIVKSDYKYEEKTKDSSNYVQKGLNKISQQVQSNIFTKNSSLLQINNKISFSFYDQSILQNFLQESRFVQIICLHELILIFILFNQFLSRPFRITQQYIKYVILITFNSILFYNLKAVFIILANCLLLLIINLIIVLIESVYKMNKRIVIYLIYLIFITIVIICFYIICISIQNKFYKQYNDWLPFYFLVIIFDILIYQIISAFIKYELFIQYITSVINRKC